MQKQQAVKLLIKTSRPPFWLGTVSFYIAGSVGIEVGGLLFWLGLIFCTFPAGLIINGINDISDRESDSYNPRKSNKNQTLNDEQVALIIKSALLFAVVFIAIFFFLQRYFTLLTLVLAIGLWAAYSLKPVRLKGKPIIDSISNGVGMLLFFILGRSLSVQNWEEYFHLPHVVLTLFAGIVAVHALQTLWDYDVDKKVGDKTIGGLLQIRGTLLFCLLIYSSIFLLFRPMHIAVAFYLLISLVLCLFMLIKPRKKLLYYSTWTILYGFPVLFSYLFIFDQSYLSTILTR